MGRVKKDKGLREHIYLNEPPPPVLNHSGLLWRLLSKASFSHPRTAVPQKQSNGEKDLLVPLHQYSITRSYVSDKFFYPKN